MAKRKKPDEDQSDNSENVNESDDNFGLPEIEYEPLNREETPVENSAAEEEQRETVEEQSPEPEPYQTETSEERRHEYVFDEEQQPSSAPKIIIGIIVVLLVVAGAWYFAAYLPKKKEMEERARQEELVRQEAARKIAADQAAELSRQEREKRTADSLANAVPKEGIIETLTGRTGQYYVVVSSDIDDDLIMDFAKKISKKGVSSKIIPPHGKVKFFRLGISEAGSYAEAQAKADGLKADYAAGAWVVKY